MLIGRGGVLLSRVPRGRGRIHGAQDGGWGGTCTSMLPKQGGQGTNPHPPLLTLHSLVRASHWPNATRGRG